MPLPLILACVFIAAAWAQTPLATIEGHIDRERFHQTLLDDLGRYRDTVPTPNGFLMPLLDRQWKPLENQTATLVSQTRLLFVMASGYELTGEVAYLNATKRGAEFVLAHFRDREFGGWFRRVSPAGEALDGSKDSYSHAFAIFGLVHAWRVTHDERFRQAALETWRLMKAHLRDGEVFIKPGATRDFSQVRGTNSQNPMMHLFEALLALYGATGSRVVFQDAQSLADAIFGKLFQDGGGYLPELYDSGWKPLPVEAGGRIELGHQFEWAYLLSQAVEQGFPQRYLATGNRLLDYGMKHGYDSREGGFFSRAGYDGKVASRTKGWWEQCEALRALMHYAALRGRDDLWAPFDKSLKFAKQHFIDPDYGGWYRSHDPDAPREDPHTHKGTHWMAGYHVTNMYLEALRLRVAPNASSARWHLLK